MKHYLYLVPLFILLAVGCAHSPDLVRSADPTPATLPAPQNPVDNNPEQNPVILPDDSVVAKEEQNPIPSKEISVKPESANVEGKEKPEPVQDQQAQKGGKDGNLGDYSPEEESLVTIADPIEPFNRVMFVFNDKLYFWALKPVSQGYGYVVPEVARVSVQNFFYNLRFPVRFVSFFLQADFKSSVKEVERFTINTIWGIGGLFDPASREVLNLPKMDVELGDTLEAYGLGHGFYIVWPILGPSSARDSVAIVGDYFLYPVSYIQSWYAWLGVRGYELINDTSLSIGNYESLIEAAIDPYDAVRDAYVQHRQKLILSRSSLSK